MEFIISLLISAVQILSGIYVFVILVRFLFQLSEVDFYNPISQIVIRITTPVLNPVRSIIPQIYNIDLAALAVAIVIQLLIFKLLYNNWPLNLLLIYSCINILLDILNIYLGSMVILAVTSWIIPGAKSPLIMILYQLIEPIVGRIRKIIPSVGGLDLSYMFFAFFIYAIKRYIDMKLQVM